MDIQINVSDLWYVIIQLPNDEYIFLAYWLNDIKLIALFNSEEEAINQAKLTWPNAVEITSNKANKYKVYKIKEMLKDDPIKWAFGHFIGHNLFTIPLN